MHLGKSSCSLILKDRILIILVIVIEGVALIEGIGLVASPRFDLGFGFALLCVERLSCLAR